MVPGEIGILPENRGVTGTLPGSVWALLGLSGKEEEAAKVGADTSPTYLEFLIAPCYIIFYFGHYWPLLFTFILFLGLTY